MCSSSDSPNYEHIRIWDNYPKCSFIYSFFGLSVSTGPALKEAAKLLPRPLKSGCHGAGVAVQNGYDCGLGAFGWARGLGLRMVLP